MFLIKNGIGFEVEPKTSGNSNADFMLILNDKKIILEAWVRRLKNKESNYIGSAEITQNLRGDIAEKLSKNGISEGFKLPVILAIDCDYAGIDEVSVRYALSGDELKCSPGPIKIPWVSGILLKNQSNFCYI